MKSEESFTHAYTQSSSLMSCTHHRATASAVTQLPCFQAGAKNSTSSPDHWRVFMPDTRNKLVILWGRLLKCVNYKRERFRRGNYGRTSSNPTQSRLPATDMRQKLTGNSACPWVLVFLLRAQTLEHQFLEMGTQKREKKQASQWGALELPSDSWQGAQPSAK